MVSLVGASQKIENKKENICLGKFLSVRNHANTVYTIG